MLRRRPVLIGSILAGVLVLGGGSPANAVGTARASWTVEGTSGAWSGTLAVPAIAFPGGGFVSDTATAGSPSAAFLNAETPFGAVFGSTRFETYLNIATAAGAAPSTTTFSFDHPTPATGWGMAFGDIDADQLAIAASGPGGPLSAEELGFQSTFSSCTVATPRPSACGGPQTDVPTWSPSTATLVGNVANTEGASAWFRPTVPITTLSLTFTRLSTSGAPIFQMWLGAQTADIGGTVTAEDETGDPIPLPVGTEVALVDGSGTTVDTVTPEADGAFAFPEVVQAPYTIEVTPPDGFEAPDPVTVDAVGTDVDDLVITLQQDPPTTTTTTTTTTSTTTSTTPISTEPTSPSDPSEPQGPGAGGGVSASGSGTGDGGAATSDGALARTGQSMAPAVVVGSLLFVAGGVAVVARRRLVG